MNNDYKIIMGNSREDYTIYYQEIQNGLTIRELAAATDVKFRSFRKSRVILYLSSFQKWGANKSELSLGEYAIVLKRIYDFLKSQNFEIEFNTQAPLWQNGVVIQNMS